MATSATVLPGQELTGNDEKDLALLVQKAVDEVYNKNKPAETTQQPDHQQPQEYKLKVFGEERTFSSLEEASKAVEGALQLTYNQALAAGVKPGQQQTQQTQETKPNGFSREKFAEIVGEDPLKGFEYALGHLLFDGQITEGVGTALKSRFQDITGVKQMMSAYQFKEMFPQLNLDNAGYQKLDALRVQLNLPADNPQAWEAAYSVGVMRGVLPPPKAAETKPVEKPQERVEIPYMGRAGGEAPPGWERTIQQAESLDADSLEKAIWAIQGGRDAGRLLGR